MKKIITLVSLFTASTATNAALVNGNFEDPSLTPGVADFEFIDVLPGWQTTDTKFELWSDGHNGVTSYEGSQHVELNALVAGTLFQEASGVATDQEVGFEFAHRGRESDDTMMMTITDLGADNIFGNADDTLLFSKDYTTGNADWTFYTSANEATITTLGNDIRLAYTAVGGTSLGNFLDDVDFGVGIATVPVPAAAWLFASGLLGFIGVARRNTTA